MRWTRRHAREDLSCRSIPSGQKELLRKFGSYSKHCNLIICSDVGSYIRVQILLM